MTDNFILFMLAGTTYALRTRDVAHVEMVEQMTVVPNAVHFVDGVVFSRGEVIPAVNLRARFGLDKIPNDLQTRLLVVQVEGRSVGLIVDSAREFLGIAAAAIQPANDALGGIAGGCIEGIANIEERLIVVLDLPQVLSFTQAIPAA